MKSLCGVQVRKDIFDSYFCKSETWKKTEFDENVLELLEITKRKLYCKNDRRRWIR